MDRGGRGLWQANTFQLGIISEYIPEELFLLNK